MPKRTQPLTALQIENATPKEKEYKMADGYGLYLLVTPSGGKLWRMNYRFDDKQKSLCFGSYTDITLDEARTMCNDARISLKVGLDPSESRKKWSATERAERSISNKHASVRVDIDGVIEIWKGRTSVRLSNDEALFIKGQLTKLLE